MFPIIRTIDDLLPHIKDNKQIRVMPDAKTGHTIVSYMIQDEDTFSGSAEMWERECRGITFHPDGTIAARCLTKFFNIGQRDDVRPENLLWGQVDRIMEKRDGSMVTPVKCGSVILFKTKKTFSSKEALLAGDIAQNTMGAAEWFESILGAGLTPTFEMTSPKYPIVIKYEKDELTLLHIRENSTGRYLTEDEINALGCPFPIVQNIMNEFMSDGLPANIVSWEKMKKAAETSEGIEGWIIQFEGGEMVKLKTKWYCDLHHSVTFTRWRDIARSVTADQADDLKGAFAVTGRSIEPILTVERGIKLTIGSAKLAVEAAVMIGKDEGLDAKGMALKFKDYPLFSQIMATFRGKEIDWMAWYEKNHLDTDWSLEVVKGEQ